MTPDTLRVFTARSQFFQDGLDGKQSGLFPQLNIHSTDREIHDAAVLAFRMTASKRFSNEELDTDLIEIATMFAETYANDYVSGLRERAAEEGVA